MTNAVLDPVIQISEGRLRGTRFPDHEAFLGVPYAAPPVGALRMAPPAVPEPWEGIRPAQHYGPTAQPERPAETPDLIPTMSIPGDDILTVNVFTPAADPQAQLPVLVWIHGGAYEAGSPASPWFNGATFTRNEVVTVTIGYRLGFHGFGVIPGEPANLGVRDWIAALEWVQQNISAFGGDPARVTIAGQSAGAGAVLTLLGCTQAAGLFRAAWVSSPTLPVRERAAAEQGTLRLAKQLGVSPTRAGLAAVTDDQLRTHQSTLTGRRKFPSIARMVEEMPIFSPVIDGELLTEPTLASLSRGVGSNVQLVIGANDNEVLLVSRSAPKWLRHVPLNLALRFAGVRPGSVRRPYTTALRSEGVATAPAAIDRSITDRAFRRVVHDVMRTREAASATTHAYQFAWKSPTHHGAIHCLDVPFLWNVLDDPEVPALAGEAPPQLLADQLHGTLVGLVHGADLEWPAWKPETRLVTHLDTQVSITCGGFDELAVL